MENLPSDLLSELFIRLLAKQLAQMRCICKSWNSLLSESSFVKSHLHHSINNNNEILLFFCHEFDVDSSSITARRTLSPDLELTNFIELPVNPQSKDSSSEVIGSVNGLICFCYGASSSCPHDYVVYIWNPSLSAVLSLPSCSLPSGEKREYHFRFGYDPKTDDYKIVKLTTFSTLVNEERQVEVYSMRKGSWELIFQRFPSNITMIRDYDKVCADGHDGHLHWLGSSGSEWKPKTIVAFDLGAETFREILLPDCILHHHGYNFHVLKVISGKLCVMSSAKNGEYEVWVMDEYGVPESWVRHHVFPLFGGDIYLYGFTSSSEFLFRDNDRFGLYDIVAAQTKTFKMMNTLYGENKIVKYVDSLVWVIPAKHELSKGHLPNFILESRQLLEGLQKERKGIFQTLFGRCIGC